MEGGWHTQTIPGIEVSGIEVVAGIGIGIGIENPKFPGFGIGIDKLVQQVNWYWYWY